MLRTRLLTATAAVALFAAPAAFAQTMPAEAAAPTQAPATAPTTTPAMPSPAMPAPAQTATPAPTSQAAAAPAASPAAQGNIIDTLRADGQFTTLLTALEAAKLTDTLKTQPAVSIFAPTDAAFAKLPEAERTRLMDPANASDLRQLLLYHVIVADVKSSQIEGTKGGVETAARTQVQLDGTGGAIKVDNATVTRADIDASNGAVFAIDSVLNPGASAVASGDAEEEAAPAAAPPAAATPPVETPPAATMPPAEASAPPVPTPPVDADPDKDDTPPVPSSSDPMAPAPSPAASPQA